MRSDIFWISFVISLFFIGFIIYLIRGRKLREQYSMLWLLLGLAMMVFSLSPSLLEFVARVLNVVYMPSLIYFFAIIGILFILLHLTVAVSSLTNRIIVLTQTVALKEEQILQLSKKVDELSARSEGGGMEQ